MICCIAQQAAGDTIPDPVRPHDQNYGPTAGLQLGISSSISLKLVQKFVQQGADVNAVIAIPREGGGGGDGGREEEGWHTAVTLSILRHRTDILHYLATEGGANLFQVVQGHSPMDLVAREGHADMTELLLKECGCEMYFDANSPPHGVDRAYGHAPLHTAARNGHIEVVELILQHAKKKDPLFLTKVLEQATFDTRGDSTALYLACWKGHSKVVSLLVEYGANVNHQRRPDGYTSLMIASQEGHSPIVETLLQGGADLSAVNEAGFTALFLAVHQNHVVTLSLFLQQETGGISASVNTRFQNGQTPLVLACTQGHLVIVNALLQVGRADPNQTDQRGASPLLAAILRKHEALVEPLLMAGANANEITDGRFTPLSCACSNRLEGVLDRLITVGQANVNLAISDGTTPLFQCTDSGYVQGARLLLSQGANVNSARTKDGYTPLIIAALRGNIEMVELLLEHGANVDSQTKKAPRQTPLMAAIMKKHESVVPLLLRHGADPNRQVRRFISPLFMACSFQLEATMRHLLDFGANVNTRLLVDGNTPLHQSCDVGHARGVQMLLESGGNKQIDRPRHDGFTPLRIVSYHGNLEIVELLLNLGASVNTNTQSVLEVPSTQFYQCDRSSMTPLLDSEQQHLQGHLSSVIEAERKALGKTFCNVGFLSDVYSIVETTDGFKGKVPTLSIVANFFPTIGPMAHFNFLEHLSKSSRGVATSTPLEEAVRWGHEPVVRRLLKAGADANAESLFVGWMLVTATTILGDKPIVQLLLDYGALDIGGQLPSDTSRSYELAQQMGYTAVADAIRKNGL